jgi:hypothetical protein
MKHLIAVVLALSLTGLAAAQSASSVVGRALQVHAAADDSSFEVSEAGTWKYLWANLGNSAAHIAVFDQYFDMEITGGDGINGKVIALRKLAFQDNQCNFWSGLPLVAVELEHQGVTYRATPKSEDPYAEKTGWLQIGEAGEDVPMTITLEDIFIAEQKVVHHRAKPKGKENRPWNTKISFDLLPENVEDLKIEVVFEDPNDDMLIFDPLYAHELVSDYADWVFENNAGGIGNPDALAKVAVDKEVVEILTGCDDFVGNDEETGGLRVLVMANPAITYQISHAGTYTIRISGKVRGRDITGDVLHHFHVTLNSTAINPCSE